MIELIHLYKWTILAGCLAAPTLTFLGSQLATRDRAMQTLCVGQGAMVGVLFGLGSLVAYEDQFLGRVGPLAIAIGFSALTYLITDHFVAKKTASKNTFFAFTFSLLLAGGYLLSAAFPALESHMAQVYFGDLATLGVADSQVAVVLSLVCLGVLIANVRGISNQSFELAVFGDALGPRQQKPGFGGFKLVTLVALSLSVQFIGFLFTVAMLFLPTALLNYLQTKGLRLHLVLCALLASASTVTGFLVSLKVTRLPTVPTIVFVMFVFALLLIAVERILLLFTGRLPFGIGSLQKKAAALD